MKKTGLFIVILSITLSCIAMEQPSYWNQFKNKLYSLKQSIINKYRWRNIPRPHLISKEFIAILPSFFSRNKPTIIDVVLHYDTSKDNDTVKALREELGIKGVYIRDAVSSDLSGTSKFKQQSIPHLNKQKLSDIRVSIYELLSYECYRQYDDQENARPLKERTAQFHAFVQLLWELEDTLPANIKTGFGSIDPRFDSRHRQCMDALWKQCSRRF